MSYTALLTQQCTYWAPGVNDGYGGYSFSAPTTILVRWQDSINDLVDINGNEFISNAIIYSGIEIELHGFLYRGVSVAANPDDVQGSQKIQKIMYSQNPGTSILVYKSIV
jgi:hypothetical protein